MRPRVRTLAALLPRRVLAALGTAFAAMWLLHFVLERYPRTCDRR
ncbi:hypothetical protein [Streptomyces sp. NPDC001480]